MLETPLMPPEDEALKRAAVARFPVRAHDLMPEITGPALGATLKRLETRWIASEFKLSKSDLLDLRYDT
jgi:hypothetical protein